MIKENLTTESVQNIEASGRGDQLKKEYDQALEVMDLETVENILNKMMELGLTKIKRYDHLQRELYGMHREKNDNEGMTRIIADTKEYQSQIGRIKNFKHVTGEEYRGFRLETPRIENIELIKITDTSSFRNALNAGQIENAKKWLEENKNNKKYDDRWLRHREGEIKEAENNK